NLGASASWLYGDAGYHRYFYDVTTRDATPGRPAYRADGGSSGRQQTLSLSRLCGNLWIGAFFKHDDLRTAVFVDSPLVQRRSDYSAGFAIGWIFARSSELVDVGD
ncbi:MipA/OmpV family protein, partial [Leptospira sp. SA-E8]|uniref:MipA/OmpV family protein n=1 Tax=Leptospira sp. SA-E8 TaxID=3422259 RepID=UPI003EBEF6B6